MTRLELEDVGFAYDSPSGPLPVLRGVSVTVASGESLAVTGPSGSGKSSLIRAGLLPALRTGAIAGSESWRYELLTPGIDPFDELHYRLTRNTKGKPRYGANEVADDPRLARRLLDDDDDDQNWLLYVDQFEEVFTQHDDPEVARAFVEALAAMADPTDSRLRVVIAVRASSNGRPLLSTLFSDRIQSCVLSQKSMQLTTHKKNSCETLLMHGLK